MMNATQWHQYLVKLALEAYDDTHPMGRQEAGTVHDARRTMFRTRITERMAQAAQTIACDLDTALPTPDQETAMEARESDLRKLEGKHAADCAVWDFDEDGPLPACDCRPDYEADDAEMHAEFRDGEAESALESVYGDNDGDVPEEGDF